MSQLSSGSEVVQEEELLRRRRLLFRAWHRESHEWDRVIGSFAAQWVSLFDPVQLAHLEALLECSDSNLFDWLFGGDPPPAQHDHDVLRLLRRFCAECVGAPQRNGAMLNAATP